MTKRIVRELVHHAAEKMQCAAKGCSGCGASGGAYLLATERELWRLDSLSNELPY